MEWIALDLGDPGDKNEKGWLLELDREILEGLEARLLAEVKLDEFEENI
jgi:hypothetical protein